jgi:hypothetical protein
MKHFVSNPAPPCTAKEPVFFAVIPEEAIPAFNYHQNECLSL